MDVNYRIEDKNVTYDYRDYLRFTMILDSKKNWPNEIITKEYP